MHISTKILFSKFKSLQKSSLLHVITQIIISNNGYYTWVSWFFFFFACKVHPVEAWQIRFMGERGWFSNHYLCVWVGCSVCLSQNAAEKLQAVSPLGLCPSLWLSGKSQTVLSISSIGQKGHLVWAKGYIWTKRLLVFAHRRNSLLSGWKVM